MGQGETAMVSEESSLITTPPGLGASPGGTGQHQPFPVAAEEEEIAIADVDDDDNADSSGSDISMSSESDSSSDEEDVSHEDTTPDHATAAASTQVTATMTGPKKRKSMDSEVANSGPPESVKKVKLDKDVSSESSTTSSLPSDRSLLPAEIWQHIFTFSHPRTLGNLLQANKLFNFYLDPRSHLTCYPSLPLPQGHTTVLQPDAIWQVSRRRFWPKMPTPLRNMTELDMWRLACTKECQYCGKTGRATSTTTHGKMQPGPGVDGVRIIWPFAVRACGSCLMGHSTKDIDLLLSSSVPSPLIPALPCVLITKEMHVYSPAALQNVSLGDVQFIKIFLSKHVEELSQELMTVKAMGAATAEEWLKGLEDRGKELRSDSARWEKWESTGGVAQMQICIVKDAANGTMEGNATNCGVLAASVSDNSSQGATLALSQSSGLYLLGSSTALSKPAGRPIKPLSFHNSEPFSRPQSSTQLGQPPHQHRARTREEANEMKAARRAEIERRAMLLDPPLTANILAHIPSFQAALQIILPLDEAAWELLKPRLLAQRAEAEQREQREQEIAAHSRILQERTEERRNVDGRTRESKELMDRDWDEIQTPLRAQISAYADEIIREGWDKGNKVDKENSPLFAIEVLLYVRKRFYAEIAKDAAARRAAGQEPLHDPLEGPFTQKLTLENMKWLFETKIKPHTEAFRRELFLCNDCDGNLKAYGFEGVIQHYAAKHTSSLSLGSVVVHWRSEWPEKPPFNPDPMSKNSPSKPTDSKLLVQTGGPPQYGYNAQHPGPSPHQALPYVSVPPPIYGGPSYGELPRTIPSPHGAYGLPGSYPSSQPPYDHHTYPPQTMPFVPTYNPAPYTVGMPTVAPNFLQQRINGPGGTSNLPPPPGQYGQNYNAYQHNGQAGYQAFHGTPLPDKIRTQLDDLARNSRQVWMATSGLKELPGNIRVYVVLHHLAKRYRSRFSESPPLAMFIDGLSNNKDMRPVRNVNGLMCKACHLGHGNGTYTEGERKTFSLPQLVNHFQHKHADLIQGVGASLLDWTIDMVYVPDLSSLSHLHDMVGMDDHKYALITEAFPQAPPATGNYPNFGGSDPKMNWAESTNQYAAQEHVLPSDPIPAEYNQSRIPAHGHDGPAETAVAEYDPHQPVMHDYRSHLPGSAQTHFKAELLPSSAVHVPPQSTLPKSHHDDSGRISPEVWRPSSSKGRKRKATSKDRRAMAGQGSKSHKGSAKSNAQVSIKEAEENKKAEEEAQRQEEQIRAMWANERRETARVYSYSTSTAPATVAVSDTGVKTEQESPVQRQTRPIPNSRQVPVPRARRESQPPAPRHSSVVILDREHDDLFAGLESHLNQQQQPPDQPHRSRPASTVIYEPRPAFELQLEQEGRPDPKGDPHVSSQRSGHFRDRSHSPVYVRYESQQHVDRYRERSLAPYHAEAVRYRERSPALYHAESVRYRERSPALYQTEPVHETHVTPLPHHIALANGSRSTPAAYDLVYERAPRQAPPDYHRIYADEEQSRPAPPSARYDDTYAGDSPAQYEEAYELLEVRDSQGSYYIKRPIRRAQESVYTTYENERPVYRETTTYRGHQQDSYARQPVYEPAPRPERYPVYEAMLRAESTVRPPHYDVVPRADTTFYEEYDPRFPALPPGTVGSRSAR